MAADYIKASLAPAVEQCARIRIELIERFCSEVNSGYRRHAPALQAALRDSNSDADASDHAELQLIELTELRDLAGELAILALYKMVELETRSLVEGRVQNPQSLFRFDSLKKALRSEFAFDLTQAPGHAEVDELRLLNNAIKHEGRISGQLAHAYRRWDKGANFGDLTPAFDRIAKKVPSYLAEIAKKVVDHQRTSTP